MPCRFCKAEGCACAGFLDFAKRNVDLAERIVREATKLRSEGSALGKDLREAVVDHLGNQEAWEASENSDASAWFDVLVDGVRGLSEFSDEELLSQLIHLGEDPEEIPDELGEPMAGVLRNHPLWRMLVLESLLEEKHDVAP